MKRTASIVGVALMISLISCSKDSEVESDAEAADSAWPFAEAGMEAAAGPMMGPFGPPPIPGLGLCSPEKDHPRPNCMVVEESEGYPQTKTISFEGDCEGHRGTPEGKIMIVTSADMHTEGATRVITFLNFGRKGRTMSGTIREVNAGQNAAGNWVIESAGSMNGSGPHGEFSHSVNGSREWVTGFETDDCSDDIILMAGTTSGEGPRGSFTKTVVEPLRMDVSCREITAGQVELEGEELNLTIDFGDESCDGKMTVTKDGVSSEVDIPRKRHCADRGRRGND